MNSFFNALNLNWDIIFLVLFSFFATIQLFYYLFFYARLGFKPKKSLASITEPISVVICARNEADNLRVNLPLVCTQDYADYEVVIVNDCSEDDTEVILNEFLKKYKNLKVTTIKPDLKFSHGKKLALTIGIKAASHDILLLTDADCRPASGFWIKKMSECFSGDVAVVLGYSGASARKGLLNKLIRYDMMVIAMQYLTYAMSGVPYMGVGRNLAYRKNLYNRNKGFSAHAHIVSGDDDLFINSVATATNTCVLYAPETHIETHPKTTFRAWLLQKKRHLTTGKLYKTKHKVLLFVEMFSRLCFYFLPFSLFAFNKFWIVFVSIFAFRLLVQMVILKIAMKRLNEKEFFLFTPVFDLIMPFLNVIFLISNKINPLKKQWR